MQGILSLILRYQVFLFFLLLESLSIYFIFVNNNYYSHNFFNTSNKVQGNIQTLFYNIEGYFNLVEENKKLQEENINLKKYYLNNMNKDLFNNTQKSTSPLEYIEVNIVHNEFLRATNYITIDKGSDSNIEPNMGVITNNGIIGIIKFVSKNFATVTSLLHHKVMVSSELKSSNTLCSVQWDGADFLRGKAKFVPIHVTVNVGDTIVTSGYNSIFPPNLLIGIIEKVDIDENGSFYDITLKFTNDFSSIDKVIVVKNNLKEEQDNLEMMNYEN